MQNVKERLISYIETKNEKKAHFERNIGASNGYINSIKNSISPDFLEKISTIYPDLNFEWLLIGKGNMLKLDEENTKQDAFVNLFLEGKIYPASAIKEKEEEIARLNKEIGRLEGLLAAHNINFKQTG